jgi:hypothetical protein
MSCKVLNVRHRRLRRLSKALLRHIRTQGLDDRGVLLRQRFDSAVFRFSELQYHVELSRTDKLRIYRVRLGLLGLQDQIEATVNLGC